MIQRGCKFSIPLLRKRNENNDTAMVKERNRTHAICSDYVVTCPARSAAKQEVL